MTYLHHVLGLQLDGELRRSGLEAIDFDDVYDFDGEFGKLVKCSNIFILKNIMEKIISVKNLGILEQ